MPPLWFTRLLWLLGRLLLLLMAVLMVLVALRRDAPLMPAWALMLMAIAMSASAFWVLYNAVGWVCAACRAAPPPDVPLERVVSE